MASTPKGVNPSRQLIQRQGLANFSMNPAVYGGRAIGRPVSLAQMKNRTSIGRTTAGFIQPANKQVLKTHSIFAWPLRMRARVSSGMPGGSFTATSNSAPSQPHPGTQTGVRASVPGPWNPPNLPLQLRRTTSITGYPQSRTAQSQFGIPTIGVQVKRPAQDNLQPMVQARMGNFARRTGQAAVSPNANLRFRRF